jgi:lipopolysaccharide biosynthesis glycosyltransferase
MTIAPQNEITVACATDETYVDGTVVMLASAAARIEPGHRLEVLVVDCGIAPSTRDKIARCLHTAYPGVRITFLPLAAANLADYGPTHIAHVTKTTYARLFLPRLLPEHRRCIYLDGDLLVDTDLAELFNQDLHGHPLAAVVDAGRATLADYGIERYLPAGTDLHQRAFNAGVMLLDLDRMRTLACFREPERFSDYEVICADQGLLNLVFAGDWLELPARWNRQVALWPGYSVYRDTPGQIWHSYKRNKPWQFLPAGAHGLIGDYYRCAHRVRWSQLTRPHLSSRCSPLRDFAKWSRASLLRQLRIP